MYRFSVLAIRRGELLPLEQYATLDEATPGSVRLETDRSFGVLQRLVKVLRIEVEPRPLLKTLVVLRADLYGLREAALS